MKVLITGAAGFIGNNLALRLLERGDEVIGIDNLNDYYDPSLKRARLARTQDHPAFTDVRIDLEDRQGIADLFAQSKPDAVVNLAAQAGVRYSIENPHSYIESNVVGTLHILEGCRHNNVEHLTYAKVAGPSWLSIDPTIVTVKKGTRSRPNEVDAITGATISSKAIVRIINDDYWERCVTLT